MNKKLKKQNKKYKLIQDQQFKHEKLEQDDENAKLRAGISLAKLGIQDMKIIGGGNG